MIAKLVKGRGFRGALDYDLKQEKGRVIDTNMAGRTPRELASEFGEIRRLRPKVGKAVLHVSLSAAPGEKLSDEQWREIGQRYLRGMGFKDNQFLITRHTDTDHEHIHILANRITFGGEVVSDSLDYSRQERIVREIERVYRLERVAPSHEAQRRAYTRGEIEHGIRTGEPSTRMHLHALCDAAALKSRNFSDYVQRLEAAGVELIPVVQLQGAKLSGLSYRLDGVVMKGSDLGRGYTPAGLAKRGIGYEQDRDFAAVRRSIERAAPGAAERADRAPEAGQAPERGGIGRSAGALGAGHGRAGGRDKIHPGRDPAKVQGAGREIHRPDERSCSELEPGCRAGGASRDAVGIGRAAAGVAPLRAGRDDGPDHGGPRERVLALGGAAEVTRNHAGPEGGGRAAETRRDRSLEAVQRQVRALGVARLEVALREAQGGELVKRSWSAQELEQSVAWLKRMNARGHDVFIRPEGGHGLVLVDGLQREALASMAKEGFTPAATIEAGPGHFQAWVKLSDGPLPAEVHDQAARTLARHYGGTLEKASSRSWGRLAGFTHQAPALRKEDRQPYVLAHESPGRVAAAAPAFLQHLAEGLERQREQQERAARLEAIRAAPDHVWQRDALTVYRQQAQQLLARHGPTADFERVDWAIATHLAKSGRYSRQEIEQALREASPHIEHGQPGGIEGYARRTATQAWNAPEVLAHWQGRGREIQRQRELGRAPERGREGPSHSL